MSDDKPKVPDENELLQQGKLSPNPAEGTRPVAPPALHVVDSRMRKIGEPADVAAEHALLGACLWAGAMSPNSLRASAIVDLLPDGAPFYNRDNGVIWEHGILACLANDETTGHKPVEHDPVAVAQHIALTGKGKDSTSVDALLKLQAMASTVSEVQARAYAESIRKCWAKREAIRDFRIIVSDALSPKVTDIQIYEQASKASLAIMERSLTTSSIISIGKSAEAFFTRLMAPGNTAFMTGLVALNTMTNGGLREPETSIFAARTGVGKSTLAAGVSICTVTDDPEAVALYVTLEMPHESFTTKLLASMTPGVTVAAIRQKVLNKNQWTELSNAVMSVKDLDLWFTVSLTQTLASVFSAAREAQRMAKRIGKRLKLVVIDHIGLVKPSELLKKAPRVLQVAETSRGLRFIATEIGCHVMALAQIHRDAERQKSADSIPKLWHLRESGDLEQDADQIFIMHRPRDPSTGMFVAGKPTAVVLAKGRMDEVAADLIDFQRGKYVDWTDPHRTFGSEYGSDRD